MAIAGLQTAVLALPFAAVLAIGYAETAEHAAVADLAPAHLRGLASGLLALTGLALTSRRPSPGS